MGVTRGTAGYRILGTGSALPRRVVTNEELSRMVSTSDEWIFSRTGIRERRVCTTETLDALAATAARRALDAAGVSAQELDLIVCSTTSADHLMPSEACAIAEALGATCPAFDVSAACAGFVFALDAAEGWFARGRARRVLVVAAEQMSRLVDWQDRATCVLFGDAAGAVVLGAGQNPASSFVDCSPSVATLHVPGVRGSSPFAQADAPASVLHMEGQRVFKFGVQTICAAVPRLCAEAGVDVRDVDHFVFHQANERILAAASARLGLEDAKVVRNLEHVGNVSSACIPLALDGLAREGRLRPGQLVALVGFGAGLAVGGCLLRWG